MSATKKYNFRAVGDGNNWTAEIIRRVTSSKTVVSKSKQGFASESDALKWASDELKVFVTHLGERNKRDSQLREKKAEQSRKTSSTSKLKQ